MKWPSNQRRRWLLGTLPQHGNSFFQKGKKKKRNHQPDSVSPDTPNSDSSDFRFVNLEERTQGRPFSLAFLKAETAALLAALVTCVFRVPLCDVSAGKRKRVDERKGRETEGLCPAVLKQNTPRDVRSCLFQ